MNTPIPAGFRVSGVHCGIKRNPAKRDLVLIVSDANVSAAGMFTTSRVAAAPVRCDQSRVPSDRIRGVVINSGNANACTGEQGRRDAESMCERLSQRVGCDSQQILVCSTGVIGRPLPMEKILGGIDSAMSQLGFDASALEHASSGILTTDTRPKVSGRTVVVDGQSVQVTGLAKGAAMIGPNMATMLAFLMTDAQVPPSSLDTLLRHAVDTSFHCISVEGHTSTNDTVLMLASGSSGVRVSDADDSPFVSAVAQVCEDLARAIVADAEGATHLVTIDVVGCRNRSDAHRIAKTVADSALVKTAIAGADPNWGRIVSAAGYCGVEFSETELSLRVNGTMLYDRGSPTSFDPAVESKRLRDSHDTHVELVLTHGDGKCRFWTCDLTQEYVRINSDYTT